MKLVITARIRTLFDRYQVRITIGVLFSLLVHGFILSLQLGIPGLGLPGLQLPWTDRRVQAPELSIRIANLAGSPTGGQQTLPQPPENNAALKPRKALRQPSNNQPLTELPNARVKQTPLRSASNSPRVAKALKSTPASAQVVRKDGTPPPADQSTPASVRSQPELIALMAAKPGSFAVPAPDIDEWWRTAPKIDNIPIPAHPLQETAPPAIAIQTPKQSLEQAAEPAPAVQKSNQQESFERPDEIQATEPKPTKTPDITMELAARRQGEEITQQEATHKLDEQEAAQLAQDLETRKLEETHRQKADNAARLLAAQNLEEAQTASRAEELTAKKREDAKKQELADAELQARELEARRQTEEVTRKQTAALALQKHIEATQKQAEEIARQKAASLEREKQEEQQATQQKALESAARLKADSAANQRENVRLAAAVSSVIGAGGSNSPSAAGSQSKEPGARNLASKALEQIGKIGLLRVESPPAIEANYPEENSRRRSSFGIVDHDIALAMYIEGWRTKIERNGNLNYAQSSKDKAREDPVVTVSVRSDGSVENIIINRSSGRADLDEAVRRIVRINARYSVFPASLARKYDVIEIRRIWNFDERIRILEEVH